MAKWSVALFGHEKPRVTGWESRAKPGDIIAVRPISEAGRWTPTEHREFLIIEVEGFEPDQIPALIEPNWDTNSYPVIPDTALAELTAKGEVIELYPQRYHNKRRFNVQLTDLMGMGVDLERMLDKEREYKAPGLRIKKTGIMDRVRNDRIPTDALMRTLAPLKVGRPF